MYSKMQILKKLRIWAILLLIPHILVIVFCGINRISIGFNIALFAFLIIWVQLLINQEKSISSQIKE
jgi:hypothetical protein